jgi:RNA polymerase sigma factor (sigma-70 family)
MPTSRTTPLAARLRQHLAALAAARPTDAELLARFTAARDGGAFAELVRRHGPAVLAVCRRVTGNPDDADDAFQATFLVLARKADRVRPAAALGGWLYGVAVRAARKALARARRRRDREVTTGELPDVPQPGPATHDPDTVRAVLEEVGRLSVAQRAAVVLCELEGRPRAAAARELGVPEGTLSSRLAAARKVLAGRLRDRGLAPAVLVAVAGAVGCPVLAAAAARLGEAVHRSSPRIKKIAEAVMRLTFVSRLKVAVVVAAVVAVGLSVTWAEPPKPSGPPTAATKPADVPTPGGRLLLMKGGGFDVVAPDGKALAAVRLADDTPGLGWLSPDGKQVAHLVPKPQEPGGGQKYQVVVRDAVGGRFATLVEVEACQLCWSPDGKALYASGFLDEEGSITADHCRIDLAARTVEKVDWPSSVRPLEWARDGKSVLVCRHARGGALLLALMSPAGKTLTDLTGVQDDDVEARLSPDGRRVLYSDGPTGEKGKGDWAMTRRLYLYDVATKKRTEVAGVPLDATVFWCCWSPDGKKIAYVWRQRHEALAKKAAKGEDLTPEEVATETETFVIVANADGSDARTVASMKGNGIMDLPFQAIDWR